MAPCKRGDPPIHQRESIPIIGKLITAVGYRRGRGTVGREDEGRREEGGGEDGDGVRKGPPGRMIISCDSSCCSKRSMARKRSLYDLLWLVLLLLYMTFDVGNSLAATSNSSP